MFTFFKRRKGINKIYLFILIIILSFSFGIVACSDKTTQLPMKYAIITPQKNAVIRGECDIQGWVIGSQGIRKVEILYNDGTLLEEAYSGLPSSDIGDKFPNYPKAQDSGFEYILDTARLPNGEQIVKIKFTGNDGEVKIDEIKINVKNPPSPYCYIVDTKRNKNPKIKQTTDKAQEVINSVIKPGMSDEQKVLTLYDYIMTHAKYNYANAESGNITLTDHSAYGILVEGIGTCTGYANAMALLLDTAGIENQRIFGLTKDSGKWASHTWNLVKIGEKYYHVDVTWDDPDSNPDNDIAHDYFKLTDRQISRDHRWNKKLYPKCN